MITLIFGATGALGEAIALREEELGNRVIRLTRKRGVPGTQFIGEVESWDSLLPKNFGPLSVVFAQGANVNDDIFGDNSIESIFDANVLYITKNITSLLKDKLLSPNSSIVILSSIWQNFSRPKKLSYSISKAAINGLVNSLVADLSPTGVRVNAVLPGVVDTPMTRQMLSQELMERVINETPIKQLVTDRNVASVVSWLLSPNSIGVNGQFVTVDNGWSNVRFIS
jgi:3-oxoacyl-[acyl-carrier protein] reductase